MHISVLFLESVSQVRLILDICILLVFSILDELLNTSHFNFSYFSLFFEVSELLLIIYNYLYIN